MNERRIRQIIREELAVAGMRKRPTLVERMREKETSKIRMKAIGRELAEKLSQIPGFPPLKELK